MSKADRLIQLGANVLEGLRRALNLKSVALPPEVHR